MAVWGNFIKYEIKKEIPNPEHLNEHQPPTKFEKPQIQNHKCTNLNFFNSIQLALNSDGDKILKLSWAIMNNTDF